MEKKKINHKVPFFLHQKKDTYVKVHVFSIFTFRFLCPHSYYFFLKLS